MKQVSLARIVLGSALLLSVLAPSPAQAGVDVDFGASVRIDSDIDLYFAVSSRYFERDRREVEHWGRRYHPDDLAVALFICRQSGAPLRAVFDLRLEGRSWWEVSVHYGVPTEVWFVPVERKPGPPYGKAYGYWRKHERGKRKKAFVLSDADLRNLAAVRFLHDYYGVSAEVAMTWRSEGRDIRTLVSDEYRGRHDRSAADDHRGPGNAGNGRSGDPPGRARGHGKPKKDK